MPLKGVRFVRDLYADPGTRPFGDLDVLVRRADLGRAGAAPEGLGARGDEARTVERSERFHHHLHYHLSGPLEVTVELHFRLSSAYGLAVDEGALWEQTLSPPSAEARGLERSLGAEVELHWLLVHLANHGYGVSLKWLVDLRRLLEAEGGPRGEGLAAAARAQETAGAVAYGLTLTAHLAGSQEARALLRQVAPVAGRPRTALLEQLARPAFFFGPGERLRGWKWSEHAFGLVLADGVAGRLRRAVNTIGFKSHLEGIIR